MAQIKISAQLLDLETKKVLSALVDEHDKLVTSFGLLTAKLDLDATVTDTNYAATCNPAATNVVK